MAFGILALKILATKAYSVWPSLHGQAGAISTGDGLGYRQGRNGDFCVTIGHMLPGLLAVAHTISRLKARWPLWGRPSGQRGSYASLIGLTLASCKMYLHIKAPQRVELPCNRTWLSTRKSSSSTRKFQPIRCWPHHSSTNSFTVVLFLYPVYATQA